MGIREWAKFPSLTSAFARGADGSLLVVTTRFLPFFIRRFVFSQHFVMRFTDFQQCRRNNDTRVGGAVQSVIIVVFSYKYPSNGTLVKAPVGSIIFEESIFVGSHAK